MFGSILRALMLRRLFESASRGHRSHHARGYGHGHGSRHAPRSGFRFYGPFPGYSRRTRGGGRVSVTGCCLPIPLALTVAPPAAYALRRRAARR